MEETIAVLGVFGSIPFIVWLVLYFRSKAHARSSTLIEKLIDKGEPVTPEIVRSLGIKSGSQHRDLKTGMILVAIAFATMIFGSVIPEDDAHEVMTGIAMFPLFVGAAFIAFWFFYGRKTAIE